jgi:hypothetical protein
MITGLINFEGLSYQRVVLDQKFVPGTIIDSAAMMNVVENTSRQELAGGK